MANNRPGTPQEIQGTDDPSSAGASAPVGWSYRKTDDGTLWMKTGPLDTNWEKLVAGSAFPDISDTPGTPGIVAITGILTVTTDWAGGAANNVQTWSDSGGGSVAIETVNGGGALKVNADIIEYDVIRPSTEQDFSGTGTLDDVALGAGFLLAAPDVSGLTITGFAAAPYIGNLSIFDLLNVGPGVLTLAHNTGSAAGSRILCKGGVDTLIPVNGGCRIVFRLGAGYYLMAVN